MTIQAPFDITQLRSAVQVEYADVAAFPNKGFHFHTGRFLAGRIGYPANRVNTLPDSVIESFAGVGNPFSWGDLHEGEAVVDLGSGAGLDSLLAAQMVGPSGSVVGIDMTPEMIEKSTHNAALLGLSNVDFRQGFLEAMPLQDACADVVISNGVLNLCPDKASVLAETFRVLKPGGRMQMSDIIVSKPVEEEGKADIALWTG